MHTLILDVNLLERSTGYNLTSREATDLLLRLFRVYVAAVTICQYRTVLYRTGVKYSTVPSVAYRNLPKNADNLRTGVGLSP